MESWNGVYVSGSGGSYYELFFLGGEMGLWVVFRVRLWAHGGEGSGM